MKFPNIEVQPHWLAALERAKEVMPNCRWVCAAVNASIEPEIEKEICEAIHEAICPYEVVNGWYFYETESTLQNYKDYRIAWLNHMIEQCLEMQQALHEDRDEEDEEEDDSEYDCPHCGGTGEGQYDGQTCSVCRGKGVCPK